MRTFTHTVTEHDPDRSWVVVGIERRSVDLETGASFFGWAAENWLASRYTIELDPWQLSERSPQIPQQQNGAADTVRP